LDDVMQNRQEPSLLSPITTIYLLFPVLLFVMGWLRSPFSWMSLFILCIIISFLVRDLRNGFTALRNQPCHGLTQKNTKVAKIYSPAIVILLIWVLMSGAGGFGFQNTDYLANNSLLKDLIERDWPLRVDAGGIPTRIVYYFGYYLPSALFGKIFGWASGNVFSFLWTTAGVLLAFFWFVKTSRLRNQSRTRLLALAFVFCLAGGLDFFGYSTLRNLPFTFTSHIERWAGFFQYSSQSTLLFWVPQHTIAAWLVVGLAVQVLYRPDLVKYLGISLAAACLWSPFGVIGVIPFIALWILSLFRKDKRAHLLSAESIFFLAVAIWIGLLIILFLSSNNFDFPVGFIWQYSVDRLNLLKSMLAFLFLEFGLLAFFIVLLLFLMSDHYVPRDQRYGKPIKWLIERIRILDSEFELDSRQTTLFVISLFTLLVLPNLKFGVANDLVMRGSIPALFVFWAFISKIVLRGRFHLHRVQRIIYYLVVAVLVAGFIPSINEISRSIANYRLGPPEITTITSTGNAVNLETISNRAGDDAALFFQWFGK
jgi:hypothetical protein